MASTTKLANLKDRVASIKEFSGDAVPVDDIASVVTSLVHGSADINVATVAAELRDTLDFIKAARSEVTAVQAKAMSSRDIPNAALELDAVVEETNTAATTILDSAEQLNVMAEDADGEQALVLESISMALFEASSFQDLTGQRINKVSKTLSELEKRLSSLALAIGDAWVDDEQDPFDEAGNVVNADALLHGPQMDGEGNSQDDIDALLASFD